MTHWFDGGHVLLSHDALLLRVAQVREAHRPLGLLVDLHQPSVEGGVAVYKQEQRPFLGLINDTVCTGAVLNALSEGVDLAEGQICV